MLKSYQEVNTVEEFLKIKAEELDYLIEEREKLDNKTNKTEKEKENLAVISNLIKELSVQLSNNGFKEDSDEIRDWNTERDIIDNKSRKTTTDKDDIKDINTILKMLSSKLKQISNQKSIQEYRTEAEKSEKQLEDYHKQLSTLSTVKDKIDNVAYQKAIMEIEDLIQKSKSILSYDERIISTYNSLKENTYKLNIFSNIDKQNEIRNNYIKEIPNDLLNNSNLKETYLEQIKTDELEIGRLSKELSSLSEEYNIRRAKFDFEEANRIQREINIISYHLDNAKNRLEKNKNIISAYEKVAVANQTIKNLSSKLSATDSREKISTIVENCKKILPENLQNEVLEEITIESKEEAKKVNSLEEDDHLKKLKTDYNDIQNQIQKYLEKNGQVESQMLDDLLRKAEKLNNLINTNGGKNVISLTDNQKLDSMTQINSFSSPLEEEFIHPVHIEKIDPSSESLKDNNLTRFDSIPNEFDLSGEMNDKDIFSFGETRESNNDFDENLESEEELTDDYEESLEPKENLEPEEDLADDYEEPLEPEENLEPEEELADGYEESLEPEENLESEEDLTNYYDDEDLESSELHEQPKKEKFSKLKKITQKIKKVRKPKKNITKKMIFKIASLAAALVLISTGVVRCSKDNKNVPKEEVTNSVSEQNETPNYSGFESDDEPIQITYDDVNDEDISLEENTESEGTISEKENNQNQDVVDMTPSAKSSQEQTSAEEKSDDLVENNDIQNDLTYLDSDVTEYKLDDNTLKIGNEVTINGNIHKNVYDAYLNENSYNSYYGTEPKRVVIGTGIVNDNGMNIIYAYSPDANQKIDELLNEGGEMVSILTANKDKYLQNYDGSTSLTPEEVKAYAEGWYNINDVNFENTKGMSK